MKRWFARVGFVAPAIAIVGLGTATTVLRAPSSDGHTAVVSTVQPPASVASYKMTDPPPPVITPISVPPGLAHGKSGGQTLSQTITLVILPADSGEG